MTKPTIRELLSQGMPFDAAGDPDPGADPVFAMLAERVEAVLALTPIDYAASDQAGGFNECLQLVRSLLDGEQP